MARGWPTRKAVTPPATSDADLESSALPAAADTHETGPEQSHADLLTDDATDLPKDGNPTGPGALRRRLERVPGVLAPRLARLVIAPGAGWLMYASFPTLNWWWAAVVAIALLSWVLVHPATTPVG
ncbi:MAG: apolipoprotein N-acyltransferase, partial [Mycobacterium sp.]|nr:apolipoprotein N-acyltransferase [Mycobacterium sp.]